MNSDISLGWPMAGDAWEVGGSDPSVYPHPVGHPQLATIFHWFMIGGYQNYHGQDYYADSATTVWSGVNSFSWYDEYTLVTILGGRGYAW